MEWFNGLWALAIVFVWFSLLAAGFVLMERRIRIREKQFIAKHERIEPQKGWKPDFCACGRYLLNAESDHGLAVAQVGGRRHTRKSCYQIDH